MPRAHLQQTLRVFAGVMICWAVCPLGCWAQNVDLQWLERFALAKDREAALAELSPASPEYHLFATIHFQTTGQLDRAAETLKYFEQPFADQDILQSLRDRQFALQFAENPQAAYEYFRARLSVRTDYPPPVTRDRRVAPASAESPLFDPVQLIEHALATKADQYATQSMVYLADRLLSGKQPDLPISAAWVLDRIDAAYYDRLLELVVKDLQSESSSSRRFGSRNAHRFLTFDELKRLRTLLPEIAHQQPLIDTIISRIERPDAVALQYDLPARQDYYQRLHAFTSTLPPAFNSLKAHTLYRLLETNLRLGMFDEALFIEYLRLPVNTSPIILARGEDVADFGSPAPQIDSPPIGSPDELIRTYLEHFFREAESPDRFRDLLKDDYLTRVFIETKILFGIGDAKEWLERLPPGVSAALTEKTELKLAPQNTFYPQGDGTAKLLVDIKAIDELIVRIYKINTSAFYRSHQQPVNADVDLDGLEANEQFTVRYDLPDYRRHRRTLELPSIKSRGVWIVDVVGGGLRCRAVIRRGSLDAVVNTHADGHALTVIDQNAKPVSGATVRIGDRVFTTGESGRVLIPFQPNAGETHAVLSDDQIAAPYSFYHASAQYEFHVDGFLPRQQIIAGETAKILLRPRLTAAGEPVDVRKLRDSRVRLTAYTAGDVQAIRTYPDIEWDNRSETAIEFFVPTDCRRIDVEVETKADRPDNGLTDSFTSTLQWPVNTIAGTRQIEDIYLTRQGDRWVLEVRGRTGEPFPQLPLVLQFTSQLTNQTWITTVQTDEIGRVDFPAADHLMQVSVRTNGGLERQFSLQVEHEYWPEQVVSLAGQPISLPIGAQDLLLPVDRDAAAAERFRLLRLQDHTSLEPIASQPADFVILSDETQRLKLVEGGVELSSLPAGTYRLFDRRIGRSCQLWISGGKAVDRYSVEANRQLTLSPRPQLRLADASVSEGRLRIRVEGADAATRVHVLASRYVERQLPYGSLLVPTRQPRFRRSPAMPNIYLSSLQLGEEYQYVLRRQAAPKYPGVLLPQPSLLLNPWAIDEAANKDQIAAAGRDPTAAAMPQAAGAASAPADRSAGAEPDATTHHPTYEFLEHQAALLANISVQDGVVDLPLDAFGDFPVFTILAINPASAIQRQIYRELPNIAARDLRLAGHYPFESNLRQKKQLRYVPPGQTIDLTEQGIDTVEAYWTQKAIWPVLSALLDDPRWQEFAILSYWNQLDAQAKMDAYSRLSSHELHLWLSRHDPAYFRDVVKPYLANKKEPQLIDDYLLDRDLSRYLELWRYQQLNPVEKALLARRLDSERESIVRELRELAAIAMKGSDRSVNVDFALFGLELERRMTTRGELALSKASLEATPAGAFEPMSGRMGGAAGELRANRHRLLEELQRGQAAGRLSDSGAAAPMDAYLFSTADMDGAQPPMRFYQTLPITRQWAESQWDRVRGVNDTAQLLPTNDFWVAVAAGDTDKAWQSLLQVTDSRHATLAALALLDIPLASDSQLPDDLSQVFTSETPGLLAMQTLEDLPTGDTGEILVGQYIAAADIPVDESADNGGAPATYYVRQVYEGVISVTNLGPARREVALLWQIPTGSMLCDAERYHSVDRSRHQSLAIEPFSTATVRYAFYFPLPGEFSQYPACVSDEERALARTAAQQFHVVDEEAATDPTSWPSIAAKGTADEVRSHLETANLRKIDWSQIYHRLGDRAIYNVIRQVQSEQRIVDRETLGFSIVHRDAQGLAELLSNSEQMVAAVGPVFHSELIDVEPVERKWMEHLEYQPLSPPRIHPLRQGLELINDKMEASYRQLLTAIAYSAAIDAEQSLAVVYYQLVSNRIAEATERFAATDSVGPPPERLQLQRDYLEAYLSLHQSDVARAAEIAQRHIDHPVNRWRERFRTLASQLVGLGAIPPAAVGGDDPRPLDPLASDLSVLQAAATNEASAVSLPALSVAADGRRLKIEYARTPEITLNYYAVDLEMLFSQRPFPDAGPGDYAITAPTASERVSPPAAAGQLEHQLPAALQNRTLLVEATSGGARSTAMLYGEGMSVFVATAVGQLEASEAADGQPVAAAYVKVYARHSDGSVRFYKDGYTDLRGRFDYAGVSSSDAATAQRFAILVLDSRFGAAIRHADRPQ